MQVFYRPKFLEDMTREELWLMEHVSPEIADHWHQAVVDTIDFLRSHPRFGRERSDLAFPGVRSWGVENFRRWIVFYGLRDEALVLFRVVSGSMNLQILDFK
jgi:plasmid stabilization system protein ParE